MRFRLCLLLLGLATSIGCQFDEPFVGGPPCDSTNRAAWISSCPPSDVSPPSAEGHEPPVLAGADNGPSPEDLPGHEVPVVVPVTYDLVYRNRPGHGLKLALEPGTAEREED
jgi:hypothetical protein